MGAAALVCEPPKIGGLRCDVGIYWRRRRPGRCFRGRRFGALAPAASKRPPNFIVVLCDDLGYPGDVSIYGPGGHEDPAHRADGGHCRGLRILLELLFAGQSLQPRRAASLLTGRYPVRTGLGYEVIMQQDDRGLPLSEVTIAKALKPAGYATALFGKWHLGAIWVGLAAHRTASDAFFRHPLQPRHEAAGAAAPGPRRLRPRSLRARRSTIRSCGRQFYDHAERFIEEPIREPALHFFVEAGALGPAPAGASAPPASTPDHIARLVWRGSLGTSRRSIMGRLMAKLQALKLEQRRGGDLLRRTTALVRGLARLAARTQRRRRL